jgi:hypothetical protein
MSQQAVSADPNLAAGMFSELVIIIYTLFAVLRL